MGFNIKNIKNNILLITTLAIASLIVYLIQFLLFDKAQDTLFYLLQDLAFLPIQVIMVTMILDRFLNQFEARKKIKKINVIISTFFVESGILIMEEMSLFDQNYNGFCEIIQLGELSKKKDYQLKKNIKEFNYNICVQPEKLEALALILNKNKAYMLNMLGNDNLLEHDSFTDMLWAVFHVGDELQSRGDFADLDQEDLDHLSNDILRAYTGMIFEWIDYINYLHNEYPFLYSAAIKKNPFI